MNKYEVSIRIAKQLLAGNHFAEASRDDRLRESRTQLNMQFEEVREVIAVDMNQLKLLTKASMVAMCAVLSLIFVSCVLVLFSKLSVAAVAGVSALVLEALSVLLFRRIDVVRASLRHDLPQYRSLYGILLLVELGEENEALRRKLQEDLFSGAFGELRAARPEGGTPVPIQSSTDSPKPRRRFARVPASRAPNIDVSEFP